MYPSAGSSLACPRVFQSPKPEGTLASGLLGWELGVARLRLEAVLAGIVRGPVRSWNPVVVFSRECEKDAYSRLTSGQFVCKRPSSARRSVSPVHSHKVRPPLPTLRTASQARPKGQGLGALKPGKVRPLICAPGVLIVKSTLPRCPLRVN